MEKAYIVAIFVLMVFAAGISYYTLTQSCESTSLELSKRLDLMNYCNDSSECKIVSLGCPFGCYRFVNENANLSEIAELSGKYKANCPECVYKCPISPEQEQISCENNKCIDKRYE